MDKTATQVFELRTVGNSLYLRIPAAFRHANQLKSGDFLVLNLDQVGIVRQSDFADFVKQPVAAA